MLRNVFTVELYEYGRLKFTVLCDEPAFLLQFTNDSWRNGAIFKPVFVEKRYGKLAGELIGERTFRCSCIKSVYPQGKLSLGAGYVGLLGR